jgi:hypothetical protein
MGEIMRTHLILSTAAAMLLCPSLRADPPKDYTADDVEQKQGTITGIKELKKGRREITLKTDADKATFIVDRMTMSYQLTTRNRKIFTEQDKVDQIVQDSNKLRRRALELKEGEMDVAMRAAGMQSAHEWASGHAAEQSERGTKARSVFKSRNELGALTQSQQTFLREEEQRHKNYGMPVRLKIHNKVIVVASKDGDDTLAVLVLGDEQELKTTPMDSSSAAEVARRLRLAKSILKDAEKAKGEEQDRLRTLAQDKLEEIVKKHPNTKEAQEAEELLKK